jgi:hypothetical protein
LLEITYEHKQVALTQTDVDTKYHTQHGLQFNKQGKLLFSNKITKAIYTIPSMKLNKSTEVTKKYEIQDVSEADRRNFNHGCEDASNNEVKLFG